MYISGINIYPLAFTELYSLFFQLKWTDLDLWLIRSAFLESVSFFNPMSKQLFQISCCFFFQVISSEASQKIKPVSLKSSFSFEQEYVSEIYINELLQVNIHNNALYFYRCVMCYLISETTLHGVYLVYLVEIGHALQSWSNISQLNSKIRIAMM